MIVRDISTDNKFYQDTYDFEYLKGPVTLGIKTADGWPALCYAHGIYEVPIMFNIQEQLQYLSAHRTFVPKQVVEIGSGRGEVSAAFGYLGYQIDSVECNPSAVHFHRATYRRFFDKFPEDNYRLYISDLNRYFPYLPTDIDTLVLVESIEHIESREWNNFFNKILPILKNNHARMIITNQKHYWPLGFEGDCDEHISLIDDDFYDFLAKHAQSILYRDQSHICLEF